MKHASDEALDSLEGLLEDMRALCGLQERKRGVFYCKSQAFAHFHEDPQGLFADLKTSSGWQRFAVNTKSEQKAFLKAAGEIL
jgi:hypothetical protein